MPMPKSLIRNRWLAIWRQPLLRLFLLAFLAECLVFQWASYVPMPTTAMDIPADRWMVEGFSRPSSDGRILTAEAADAGDGRPVVIVQLPQAELRAIYLDAYSDRPGPIVYTVQAATERSSAPLPLANGEIATGIGRSRSLLVWPGSRVVQLRLTFELAPGQRLYLNRLILNRRIPFEIDSLRILLILAIGSLLHLLFTAPVLLRRAHPDDLGQRLVTTATGALIVILCLWLAIASASSPFFDIGEGTGDLYSRNLTDALAQGRFDLLSDPPPELAQLANPYDPAQRATVPAGDLIWDASLFNGRYYVSYGVVPALLLFVPFHVLSGYYLQTAWAVFLFGTLGMLMLFLNVRRLLLIHFPRLAFRWHLAANLGVCAAGFAGWGLARPMFYELASLGGLCFLMLAASQLLRAVHGRRGAARRSLVREAVLASQPPDQPEQGALAKAAPIADPESDRIMSGRLFLTSLFLMLAVGCQPVQALALLPYGLILAWLLRGRARRNRQTLETLFFFILPLLAIGALLAAYNQARFGSILEFGGRYRLTFADLRTHGPNLARLLPGLGQHLLTPPVIDTVFPFVHFPPRLAFSPSTFFPSDGRTVGLLTLPFLTILPLMPLVPRLRLAFRSASRSQQALLAGLAFTGLIIAAFDSMTIGAIARSAIDFGVWLALAAALAWLMLANRVDNLTISAAIHRNGVDYPQNGEKLGTHHGQTAPGAAKRKRRPLPDAWFALFLVATALTLAMCALLFLQGESDRIRTYTPQFYEQLRRTIAFWLP